MTSLLVYKKHNASIGRKWSLCFGPKGEAGKYFLLTL